MDIITSLNLATAGELALISFFIGVIVQAIKKTGKVKNTYLPFISMGIGILAGLAAVVVTKDTNYLNGAVAGLIVGAATSGLTDGLSVGTSAVTTAKATKDAAKTAAITQAVLTSISMKQPKNSAKVEDDESGNSAQK
ncbi:holin [Lactiplantibacillus plantarum]|uniref:holin n=1 Tax=Lactiplantibacillus plantarum TaxID=1590 RepID=UPI00093168BE|nr:holin [Lactiplantibacillus plantarum]